MLQQLNKFLYLPPRAVLAVNAAFFAVVFTFAVIGYFSDALNKASAPLASSDASRWTTMFILLLGALGIGVLIYGRTRKFFLCWYQGLRAAAGTTVLLTLLYAIVWSLVQVAERNQQFALFQPRLWNAQVLLNNLKYGSVLLLFSSVLSMLGSLAISVQPGYDFNPFISHWNRWKGPVQKLSQKILLTENEHAELATATRGMLQALDTSDYVQPIARASVKQIRNSLATFQSWYEDAARPHPSYITGLDSDVEQDAMLILRMC